MYNEDTITKLRKCVGVWEVTCLVNLVPDFALKGNEEGWEDTEIFNHLTSCIYYTRSPLFNEKCVEHLGDGPDGSDEFIVNFVHAVHQELHENPEYKKNLRHAEILQSLTRNELWVNRNDIIRFLVKTSVETVSQDVLHDMFARGFKGYENMSNEDLEHEWLGYTYDDAEQDIEQLEPYVKSLETKLRDLFLDDGGGFEIRIRPYDMPEEMELFWIEDL